MTRVRYEDESPSRGLLWLGLGLAGGVTAGMLLSQRFGGFRGVIDAVRGLLDEDEEIDDSREADDFDIELEERVLEAFRNDPVLSERAVDIGAIGDGIIELTGWVHSEEEANHASTLARGVPDVETVVNRLAVREDADELADAGAGAGAGADDDRQRGSGYRGAAPSDDPDDGESVMRAD